jgi:hypothetical protein
VQRAEGEWFKKAMAGGAQPLDESFAVWYRAFNGLPRWKLELRATVNKLRYKYPDIPA